MNQMQGCEGRRTCSCGPEDLDSQELRKERQQG